MISAILYQTRAQYQYRMSRSITYMTQQQEKQTFTVEEAAKILGLGRQTAYDLARKGELPGVRRLGRRFIVSKTELEAYLQGSLHN